MNTRITSTAAVLTFCLPSLALAEALDFGLDANGEFVVLTKGKVTRYAAGGQAAKWSAGIKSHAPGAFRL
jgi:hypothetical protein